MPREPVIYVYTYDDVVLPIIYVFIYRIMPNVVVSYMYRSIGSILTTLGNITSVSLCDDIDTHRALLGKTAF